MYTSSPTPNESDWFSWGASYSPNTVRIYINGEQEATSAATLDSSVEVVNIGSTTSSTGKNHDGEVSYFCFYNRALTADEFRRLDADPYQFLIPE